MSDSSSAQTPESYRYFAFISYSRKDNKDPGREWASWIKKAIEGFRVPENRVGDTTKHGTVPAKMGSVFFDKSDLAADATVDAALIENVKQSQFLVVLCSPHSAGSKYVGIEIEQFIRHNGGARVIRVVIAGEQKPGDEPPKFLHDALSKAVGGGSQQTICSLCGGELDPSKELPDACANHIYVDFRVKEEQYAGPQHIQDGWTSPKFYRTELSKGKRFYGAARAKRVADYEKEYEGQYYLLLATLLGLKPRDLQEDDKREQLKRQRRWLEVVSGVTAFALLCAALTTWFWWQSVVAQRKTERSLQMIGDAHENVVDVLVELRGELRDSGNAQSDEAGRWIVEDYFDGNAPTGTDDDSVHMRSVILNGQGSIARRSGDLSDAEKFFSEALRLRRQLAISDPDNALFQHNVALTLDHLGDLYAGKGEAVDKAGGDGRTEYAKALVFLRESLAISLGLANRPDATNHWRHDLAVSYMKVGDALYQGGDKGKALEEFQKGYPVAAAVASADPEYAKWQAHLGLYCLVIGGIHVSSGDGRETEAREMLTRGRAIFAALKQKGHLSKRYASWAEKIEITMQDLSPEVK